MSLIRKSQFGTGNGMQVAFREAGLGEAVLMFHCSASSGGQWEKLMEQAAVGFHAMAPDMVGYGASGDWLGRGPLTLAVQAGMMLELAGKSRGGGVHLVGHSCGGAVALRAALALGPRLRSLTLIEPSVFHLLRRGDPGEVGLWYEISNIAADVWHGVRSGDVHGGMARFIDYWSGPGAWSVLQDDIQDRLARQANRVATDFAVLFSETTGLEDYGAIQAPVQILQGSLSPAPSRRLCAMLESALPNSRLRIVEGAGHMSPMTHAAEVNGHILEHLSLRGTLQPSAAA